MLDATESVLLTILASPESKVTGKKRLQKLVKLGKCAGLDFDVSFELWDYGPFSRDVAQAADLLEFSGAIQAHPVQIQPFNYIATEYVASAPVDAKEHLEQTKRIMGPLAAFTTVQLEVASTIAHFKDSGMDLDSAIDSTKRMKPRKVTQPNIEAAVSIFEVLESHGRESSKPTTENP